MSQNHLKRKVSNHYEEVEAPVEFASTVEEPQHQVFISAETALREIDFRQKFHQYLRFFLQWPNKVKLETQIKTLKNIVDEKLVGLKEAITIISSINVSRKLLVPEVLKLVRLILLVPTTIAVSERSRLTLCRVKTYLRSAIMTQEPVTSCLIITTYKKQVDKLKLIEAAPSFNSKIKIAFQLKNTYFPRSFLACF